VRKLVESFSSCLTISYQKYVPLYLSPYFLLSSCIRRHGVSTPLYALAPLGEYGRGHGMLIVRPLQTSGDFVLEK
jgi:hypothetical protein